MEDLGDGRGGVERRKRSERRRKWWQTRGDKQREMRDKRNESGTRKWMEMVGEGKCL